MKTRGVEKTALRVGFLYRKLTVVTQRYSKHIKKPTQSLDLEDTNPARASGNILIRNSKKTRLSCVILLTIS